jgi:type I restriction enzyme S subunit
LYAGLFDGPHATPKPSDAGPIFLGIKNVTEDGRLDFSDIRHISEDEFSAWTRRVEPSPGDIVFTYEATLNRYAIVPNGFRGCLGRRMALIRPDASKMDTRFLHYYFFTKHWRQVIAANMLSGATVDRIPLTKFPNFPVTLPGLPEQRRISGMLSAYDDLVANNLRRIKILEEMARALYREWFVEFKFPGCAKIPRVTSAIGPLPEGWNAVPFDKLLISMTGGDWGAEQPDGSEIAEVTIVRGTDFDEVAYGGGLRCPVRYIKSTSLKSRGLQAGDVIVENSINAKSRCVGTTLLIDRHSLSRLGRDSVAASFCKVFRLHDPRLAPLVHLHLRHLREEQRMEYYQNVAANGIANFQAQRFAKEEHLPLPADGVLRAQLIKTITSILDAVGVLASEISNLRLTRDLLLPRLLSGQIPVAEAKLSA